MSTTPAIRALRKLGIAFTAHEYRYEERGGTRTAAQQLGVDEHAVIKTLVMEDETREPLIVLMHGDREVSTRQLARQIARKRVQPCDPAAAHRHTGYTVGGISPFGTARALPVFVERSILDLDAIFLNGGRRGLLVRIAPGELTNGLAVQTVEVAIAPRVY